MQINIDLVKENPNNPRLITDEMFEKLKISIRETPEMREARPIVVAKGILTISHKRDESGTIIDTSTFEKGDDFYALGGNMRLKAERAIGNKEVFIFDASDWDLKTMKGFVVKDNLGYGTWNYEDLYDQYDINELMDYGLEIEKMDDDTDVKGEKEFTTEILEENNYIIFTFNNKIDFQSVEQLFNLETKLALDSKEGYERSGIGRVIDGVELLRKLNDNSNS